MKKFIVFVFRILMVALFEWITYHTLPAQSSIIVTANVSVVLTSSARVSCHSVTWLGDARISLNDSSRLSIQGSIEGFDSMSRFFVVHNQGTLERSIDSLTTYVYPIGYGPTSGEYRGFAIDMKSLGQTGSGFVSIRLVPAIQGSITYERYFPPSDPSCVAGSWIAFNCLSADGWHCDGPHDYEYTVRASSQDHCGGSIKRVIKTSTSSSNWQDSIESVIGSFSENLCNHSDWTGNVSSIPGGVYRDFSDFAIASSTSLLPVTLVDVRADGISSQYIRVSWETALEINNDRFLVGRSTDGQTFTVIGEVAGSGTTTTPQYYFFDDHTALPNVMYYYQLEQVDYDGKIHWSPIVSAIINRCAEILETHTFNMLGQEISEHTPGIQIIQVVTRSGSTCSKVFKPLRE